MKIKIFVNESVYDHSCHDFPLPRVLTEKQYEELVRSMVKERMKEKNLVEDDGFDDWLGCEYQLANIFFMSQEEKDRIIKEFEERARENAYEELEDYYDEHEIEI